MTDLITKGQFLILFCALIVFADNSTAQVAANWNKAQNGIEYQSILLTSGSGIGKQLLAAKISTSRQGLKILRAQDFGKRSMTAKEACLASGAVLCINSSFFDEKNNPLGLLISSGITFQKPHMGGDTLTGIFASTRKSFHILSRDNLDTSLFLEAVQAGPRLVLNGTGVSDFKDKGSSRRSGVCIDKQGAPIFFITDNDSWAITLEEFASVMTRPDIGCISGINLDGGGSAQLYMRTSNSKNILPAELVFDIKGQEESPVFIAVVEGLKF